MIRRPPRSTLSSSSAASDVYKRQDLGCPLQFAYAAFMAIEIFWLFYHLSADESSYTSQSLITAKLTLCALALRVIQRPIDDPVQHLVASSFTIHHFCSLLVAFWWGAYLRCFLDAVGLYVFLRTAKEMHLRTEAMVSSPASPKSPRVYAPHAE
eukprot:TRINITY_DN34785_c0_g1_i2.p1 TRINITY_DN34785_c0_g1~~TRINITY_DN34785_c0_g1_i2.p1  ORF type:complete len:154 (+),score=21.82 TRINITY_DN34785_c0_g1_i2:89-550(+)